MAISKMEIVFPVKKIVMRPFVKGYLKKQQATYIADLKKKLSEA